MNLIIPINSDNYDIRFLRRFPDIYEGVNIHLVIMGKKSDKTHTLLSQFPNKKKDNYEYNYSYAINSILKDLPRDELSIISDSYSAFSLWHARKKIKKINFDVEYLKINMFYNNPEFGRQINFESERLMTGIMNKIIYMKSKEIAPPIIITRNMFIIDIINGLNESFKTCASRFQLDYQLNKYGLTSIDLEKEGLTFNNKEKSIINEESLRNYKYDKVIFLQNNLKSINEKTQKTKIPIKKLKLERPVRRKEITKKSNILLIIQNDIKYLLLNTPLIKELASKNLTIDILTNDKLDTVLNLLPNDLIQNKFDLKDMNSNYIDFKSYDHIIKNAGCDIKLDSNISFINNKITTSNLDSSIVLNRLNIKSSGIIYPICDYSTPKRGVPQKSFLINVGFRVRSPRWLCQDALIYKLSKNRNNTIILLHLEKELFPPKTYLNKNIIILRKLRYTSYAGYLKTANIFITDSNSDSLWLAYATKCNTIIVGSTIDVPNVPWFTLAHDGFIKEKSKDYTIESVISEIWRKR